MDCRVYASGDKPFPFWNSFGSKKKKNTKDRVCPGICGGRFVLSKRTFELQPSNYLSGRRFARTNRTADKSLPSSGCCPLFWRTRNARSCDGRIKRTTSTIRFGNKLRIKVYLSNKTSGRFYETRFTARIIWTRVGARACTDAFNNIRISTKTNINRARFTFNKMYAEIRFPTTDDQSTVFRSAFGQNRYFRSGAKHPVRPLPSIRYPSTNVPQYL